MNDHFLVSLTKVPHYRGWTFGKGDVEELLFALSGEDGLGARGGGGARPMVDGARRFPRPSRVLAMLASRACRSAVMVGDALAPAQMRRLLRRMAAAEHPWNCPHGRPTMRHMVSLRMVSSQVEDEKKDSGRLRLCNLRE